MKLENIVYELRNSAPKSKITKGFRLKKIIYELRNSAPKSEITKGV